MWDKDNGGSDFADFEMAWTSFNGAARLLRFRWAGMLQGNMKQKEVRIHPTPKPVALYTDAQRVHDSSVKTDARTVQASASSAHTQTHTAATFRGVGLGGALFAKSLLAGGSFANDVIGTP